MAIRATGSPNQTPAFNSPEVKSPASDYIVRRGGCAEEESPGAAAPSSPVSTEPFISRETETPMTPLNMDIPVSELPSAIHRLNSFLHTRRIVLPCTPVSQKIIEENQYQKQLSEQLGSCAHLLGIFLECSLQDMSDYTESEKESIAEKIKTYTNLLAGNYGFISHTTLKNQFMDIVDQMQDRLLDPSWSSFFGLSELEGAFAVEERK